MLKSLIFALGLVFTTDALANFVKEEAKACGVGKVCLDSSYLACKVKPKQKQVKKANKKKLIAKKQEKPCEQVVNNYYSTYIFEEVQSNVPYSLIHDTPITNIWTQPSSYHFGGGGGFTGGFGGFGMGGGYYIARSAQEGTVTPVIAPPSTPNNNLTTPLPSAFWLFISVFGFIFRRVNYETTRNA